MPADVIIDPSTGQIYWNDGTGTPQSISIKGDALNAISVTGYSASFSPGSSVGGTTTLVTFNDNSGTDALVPGTTGFNLGSSTLRWNTFATNANLSGTLLVADSTISSSLITGSVRFNGGIAISGNASIGQSFNLYGAGTAYTSYTGFKAGSVTSNTLYTLPLTYPSTGTSVLQSDTSGIMSWVPLSATSASGGGGTVASGTQYQIAGYYAGTGASVAGSSTFINNTATGQVQILHTTASIGTSIGALQVAGGVGISGRLTFNQAAFGTTGIATLPTMAMIGQTGDPIYMSILEDNSISFEGSQGQLFSISPNLSTGYIWAVNDISGVPLLRANVNGNVYISEFGGNLGVGQTNPTYKLDTKGSFGLASSNDSLYNFIFSNAAASGSNSLQIRSANSILFFNSGNSFYTGFKSNASANKLYVLPVTDGSNGQFLQTDGNQNLSWATASGGSGSGSTGVNPGGQYEVAIYAATGASVSGSSTLKNDTAAAVVSISHSTASLGFGSGALTVSGGVGIGGTLNVGGIGASIVGINISNSTITRGTWNGTIVSTVYGGTGLNLTGLSGVLTVSSGTVSASTTSSAISSALSDETGSGFLVFNSQPSFGTGVTTGDSTFAVFNTNATTINAFGAATALSLGAASGTATFNSVNNSTLSSNGALVVTGGAGFGRSISIAGRLQLFNGATNYTAFVSSASGSTFYTLPASTPATGTSVLQSDSIGNMLWVPMVASSGAGNGTVALGNQYQIAGYYWSATGASVSGSSTFTNNIATNVVNISHNTASISTATGALTVTGGVGIGGSLYTGTGFSSSISGVIFANGNASASTYNKVIITTPASSATLTLADGSSLITSGGNSLTFTTTAPTNVTLPTSGTLVNTAVTSLSSLTTASSLNSVGTITSGTWSAIAITSYYGGTGHSSFTNGDLLVGFGGTLAKLAASSNTGYVLTSTGAGSVPTWQAVPPAAASSVAVTPTTVNSQFSITAVSSASGTGLGLSTIASLVINPSTGLVTLSGLAVTAATNASSTTSAALSLVGGLGVTGNAFIGGTTVITNNQSSSSITSGSLQITGGLGLVGNAFIGGTSVHISNQSSSSVNSGSVTLAGGIGIAGNAFIGGTTNIISTATSISSTSGALVVTGGVGIGGSLFTATGSSSSISGVIFANGNASASTYNKVTITAPASSATLTLADGSSLVTSGTNSLTLTTTAPTNVTFPTSGTLVNTAVTSLASLTTASSLNSVGTITVGTWAAIAITSYYGGTGHSSFTNGDLLVGFGGTLAKLPASSNTGYVLTSTGAGSVPTWQSVPASAASSVAVTPTAVNSQFSITTVSSASGTGLGLSTVASLVINPSTGLVSLSGLAVTSISPSTSSTTGALVVSGGAGIGYSLFVGGMIRTGSNAFVKTYSVGDVSLDNGTTDSPALTYYYANNKNFGHDVYTVGAGSTRWRVARDINESTGAELFSIDTTGAIQIYNGANYSGFRFSGNGQTIYTLPSQSPQSAVGTSVLTSTIAGVLSWVGMSAGGSGSPGGNNKQIQYNNSTAFGGASGFEYSTGGIAVTVSIFSPSGTGYSSGLWINAIDGVTTRVGIGLSNPQFELEINGEISATNKSFVIDHPTKSGMKLRYGSLEGPENGVYVRGELEGTNIIEVPDHWKGLVHPETYTVHLTPIGRFAHLYVEKIENYNVHIADNFMSPIHCYYSVWAERKDIPKLVTEYEAQ